MKKRHERFISEMNELAKQIKLFLDTATAQKWIVKAKVDAWSCYMEIETEDPVVGKFDWGSPYVELIRIDEYIKLFGPYEKAVDFAKGALYGLLQRRINYARESLGFIQPEFEK